MAFRLKKLHLINFKCFREHTIFFDENTIMVGQNNAGKTTVVEALRILGLTTARLKATIKYISRPAWLDGKLALSTKGIRVSANAIDTDLEQVFFSYGEPPAIIQAFFTNEVVIKIFINNESEMFATFSHRNTYIASRTKVNNIGVPNVRVLPQIVPLFKEENFVSAETLQRNKFSKRTSGNFRNNLLQSKDQGNFFRLQEMIAETWGLLKIEDVSRDDEKKVFLYMRDEDFVTEIYYMGHGIQMWIQTLWFIASSDANAIIVLDEPDVYMHADLQRKLVRMLKNNFSQMIIASHSVEIISEVQPENILIINRKNETSLLADGYPVLQTAISGMGSIHNINLSRLLNNRRYLYVEGNDMDILKIFYDKLFPAEPEPLDHFPCIPTGGWGSWQVQKEHARNLLKEIPDLKVYFFYDRDFHERSDIEKREDEARSNNINIHIWKRKEIENYTIVSTAIARFICKKNLSLLYEDVCLEMEKIIEKESGQLKDHVVDKISDERFRKNRSKEVSTVFRDVQKEIDLQWTSFEAIVKMIPGKTFIGRLSGICKERYNVSFNAQQIASAMNRSEIDREIERYLSQIRESK